MLTRVWDWHVNAAPLLRLASQFEKYMQKGGSGAAESERQTSKPHAPYNRMFTHRCARSGSSGPGRTYTFSAHAWVPSLDCFRRTALERHP